MRAMTLDGYSMQPRLKDLPAPTPGPDEVLVRVRATSVNPIDWKQASGKARPFANARFPDFIPGYDLAGEVTALGANVKTFTVGQRVHTRLSSKNAGANAELVVAQLDVLCPMPASLDFAEAAALPLAGMTALQGLRDGCGLPLEGAKERVCIIGASGGVVTSRCSSRARWAPT
jgi:alcohol dehydrogenase